MRSFYKSDTLPSHNRVYCPICGRVTTWKDKLISLEYRQMSFSIVFCVACNMAIRYPGLTNECLSRYYSGYNRNSGGEMDAIFDDMYPISLKRLNLIGRSTKAFPRSCLEIGPGAGTLLSLLRQQGMKVLGLEADPVAAEWMRKAKQLNIISGFFDHFIQTPEFHKYRRQFDLIVVSHVLEHVPRPIEFLAGIRHLIDERNGYLYVEVPDIVHPYSDSVSWKSYCDPGHLYYYSPDYLRLLFLNAGYEIITLSHAFGAPYFSITCLLKVATVPSNDTHLKYKNDIRHLRKVWLLYRAKHMFYRAPIHCLRSLVSMCSYSDKKIADQRSCRAQLSASQSTTH